jgi:hypothetical protein
MCLSVKNGAKKGQEAGGRCSGKQTAQNSGYFYFFLTGLVEFFV